MNYPIPFWLLVEPNTPVNFFSYNCGVVSSSDKIVIVSYKTFVFEMKNYLFWDLLLFLVLVDFISSSAENYELGR